jgi:hypothetical protein
MLAVPAQSWHTVMLPHRLALLASPTERRRLLDATAYSGYFIAAFIYAFIGHEGTVKKKSLFFFGNKDAYCQERIVSKLRI